MVKRLLCCLISIAFSISCFSQQINLKSATIIQYTIKGRFMSR